MEEHMDLLNLNPIDYQSRGTGLILTRKPGQRVLIGKNVWVTVLGMRGNQVKMHFEAPKTINIVREELIDRDNLQALFLKDVI